MNEMITSENLKTYTGRNTLGKIEEILIEFGIEDESVKRDIFHSHLTLIVTRKTINSRVQFANECDDVVLNQIFCSDDKTALCWGDDECSCWQEAVADAIDGMWDSTDIDYVSDIPLQERLQEIRDKVIGLIEEALK